MEKCFIIGLIVFKLNTASLSLFLKHEGYIYHVLKHFIYLNMLEIFYYLYLMFSGCSVLMELVGCLYTTEKKEFIL